MTRRSFARHFGRPGVAGLLSVSMVTACGELPHEVQMDLPQSQTHQASLDGASDPAARSSESYFALEEAMGAQCDARWVTEPPLQDSACYGILPEHVARFIRAIPEGHPYLSAALREEAASEKQRFRAIRGSGDRPDILAVVETYGTFWIRSVEGRDPEVTIYVVYGPSCSDDRLRRGSAGERCLPGEPYVTRELRAYRVRGGGEPEDVTRELLPQQPTMTPGEKSRYGIYLRPEEDGLAADIDIGLDVTRLAQVPVMRWVLRPVQEGEYEAPSMPASDPRAFLDYDWRDHAAHFGFVAWNGERFELRETVLSDLWPCRPVQPGRRVCGAGSERAVDRYLTTGDEEAGQSAP